ncbi:MAG: mechanosensitive ion channel family protein [Sideroxydans sp.]|nr:mechanosensitive ion channel family protein [Sideroxydans sp.]
MFEQTYFGNTILAYLTSLAILLGGMAAIYVFKRYILNHLKKLAESSATTIDDLLVKAIERTVVPILYFGVLYASIHTLQLSRDFERGFNIAAIVLVTILVVRTLTAAVHHLLRSNSNAASEEGGKQIKGIGGLLNFLIWMLALLFLLDNLGVKISAMVAGLGIGGIAVALAAQAVLGDLFSYFVIFFDKPFAVGDFIVVDDKMGVVEHVGIKTTRIKALSGEQLVFSNTDLTNSRVHNFKKMERRRVVFKLGVTYQTPAEQLKRIPQLVKDIIVAQQDAEFDRGHFANYGDFSLNFEFVYYVIGADYAKYMDIQQAINLAIFEAFEKEGIEFAYPSQTLFVNKVA